MCIYPEEDACCPDCCPWFHRWMQQAGQCFKPTKSECSSVRLNAYNSSINATRFDSEYAYKPGIYDYESELDAYVEHPFNLPCRMLRYNSTNLTVVHSSGHGYWDTLSSQVIGSKSESGFCVKNFTELYYSSGKKVYWACSNAMGAMNQFYKLRVIGESFVSEYSLSLTVNGLSSEKGDGSSVRLIRPTSLKIACTYG